MPLSENDLQRVSELLRGRNVEVVADRHVSNNEYFIGPHNTIVVSPRTYNQLEREGLMPIDNRAPHLSRQEREEARRRYSRPPQPRGVPINALSGQSLVSQILQPSDPMDYGWAETQVLFDVEDDEPTIAPDPDTLAELVRMEQERQRESRMSRIRREGSNLQWTGVQSSAIAAVAYSEYDRVLFVLFKKGQIYTYDDVSAYKFHKLMNSESKGEYLNKSIIGKPDDHRPIKLVDSDG